MAESDKDIEFIKWMVDYAEGFRWEDEGMFCPSGCYRSCDAGFLRTKQIYPFLRQRAVEGVNRESEKWIIIQTNSFVRLVDKTSAFKIPEVDFKFAEMTIDQAKEAALMYIWEQETK
ncbi:hypothetical protein KAR91_69940 [Candidatus Pacearchaeota archaeon]|nr:hypothetical protein [Candidatus Pacearchaeota archaeon]